MQHQTFVWTAAFSPDGRRVVTGAMDSTARVWDAATGAPLGPALQHRGQVHSVLFSPDGRQIATAAADNVARLWPVLQERRGQKALPFCRTSPKSSAATG